MLVGLVFALGLGDFESWFWFVFLLSSIILNASLLVWSLVWFSGGKVSFGGGFRFGFVGAFGFSGLVSCLTGMITGGGIASPCFSPLTELLVFPAFLGGVFFSDFCCHFNFRGFLGTFSGHFWEEGVIFGHFSHILGGLFGLEFETVPKTIFDRNWQNS